MKPELVKLEYEGQWENDKYNGYGVFYLKDSKQKIEGTFKDGDLQGPGIILGINGNKLYEGQIKDFKKEGQISDYKRDGHGIEFDQKKGNKIYDGQWKQDLRHGDGTEYVEILGFKLYEG